jgi:hypothetical protein
VDSGRDIPSVPRCTLEHSIVKRNKKPEILNDYVDVDVRGVEWEMSFFDLLLSLTTDA